MAENNLTTKRQEKIITQLGGDVSTLKTNLESERWDVIDELAVNGGGGGSGGGDTELETSFRSLIDNTFGASVTKLPEGLTSIGNYAFYAKQNLAITEIPEGVVELGESAFPSCHSLITLELPTTLEKIGMSCFASCQNLKEVIFKSNIKQLGNNSIYNCGNLEKVVFSGVTAVPTLGNNAFTNSTTKLKIYVPDNLLSSFKTATNWKSHESRLYPISEL